MTVVRLFGRPTLADGSPLALERLGQMAVVLATRAAWTTREALMTMLWPERPSEAARRNLRRLLFRARREAWLAGLEQHGDSLRWPVASDAREFDAACDRHDWAAAVALYRGAFCDGFEAGAAAPFVEWLGFERNRTAAQFRAAATARLQQLDDDPAARERVARRWCELDPHDEDALAALVEAERAQGRDDEARRAIEQFTRRLAQDMGIASSARVQALAAPAAPAQAVRRRVGFALVGRRNELREAAALLARPECRVLTLLGPGGIGKSALARAVADAAAASVPAVHWIGLEDLLTGDQVVPRIVAVLGLKLAGKNETIAELGDVLREREVLLVLDNAEHLVPGLTTVVERLVASCPGLRVLLTSRVRLGVPGEWLLPVNGLPTPDADETEADAIRAFDAVKLFELRALAAAPALAAAEVAPDMAALVRLLDGAPLAIELAAVWARLLPVADIRREIERSIDLLEGGEHTPGRQRSVRASFEHSWRLLGALEQRGLAQLAVFAGPFTRAAAQQVAGCDLPVLAALADKSLLRAQGDGRFSFHPLVQQCALDRLPEVDAVRQRHRDYYAQQLGRIRESDVGQAQRLQALDHELEDCRAAWRHAIASGSGAAIEAMAPVLARYFAIRGRKAEGLALLREAFAEGSDAHGADAAVEHALAALHYQNGELELAEAAIRRALRAYRARRRTGGLYPCVHLLGVILVGRGAFGAAKRYFERARQLAEAAHDLTSAAKSLNGLAACARAAGDYAQATALQRQALERHEAAGNVHEQATLLNDLGVMLFTARRYAEAESVVQRALALTVAHGLAAMREYCLITLGMTEIELCRLDAARRHLRESLHTDRSAGVGLVSWAAHLGLARIQVREGEIAGARTDLHEGLRRARAMASVPAQMYGLAFVAEWLVARAQRERAAAIWSFILTHPLAEVADRDDARHALQALGLNRAQRAAAARAAAALEFDALLDALIAETAG